MQLISEGILGEYTENVLGLLNLHTIFQNDDSGVPKKRHVKIRHPNVSLRTLSSNLQLFIRELHLNYFRDFEYGLK